MGERKGTNKYYPPDFNPRIHKNLNAYHGTHALRERGRKADQGILTIRFEMPFNCWCLTCKNPIGMGVRYNAEKTKVGMYHSTPIYKFTMPCAICAGTIVMQTDPQNFDYIFLEGGRRKHQKWDPEENEQPVIADAMEKKKLALDAMYHLEHDKMDMIKASAVAPAVQQLEEDRKTLKDDFLLNQLARKQFRTTKRLAIEKEEHDRGLLTRLSLTGSEVALLPEEESDIKAAKFLRLVHNKRDNSNDGTKRSSTSVDQDIIFNNRRTSSISCSPVDKSSVSPSVVKPVSLASIPNLKSATLNYRASAFVPTITRPGPSSETSKLLTGVIVRRETEQNGSKEPCNIVPSALVAYGDSEGDSSE